MIDSEDFVRALKDIGCDFFTGVPDTMLAGIIDVLSERRLYTPAVGEDQAVALAAGAFFGGKIPVVLMENSGLGNAFNILMSLNLVYTIPCIMIISWRGFEGKDANEHLVMGQTMPQLLDLIRIPYRTFSEQTIIEDLQWTAKTFMEQRIPVALLIKNGIVKTLQP